jgi:hypothetical protein
MKRCLILAYAMAMWGAANADDGILTPDGLAPVKLGWKVPALENVVRYKIMLNPAGCSIVVDYREEHLGISYMLEESRVTRISVDYYGNSPSPLTIRTAAGIGLGSTEDEVMKAYADRIRVEPYDGDPSWHHLYVDEPDHSRGMAFDTDGKKVKSMRTGEYPSLRYAEGCR